MDDSTSRLPMPSKATHKNAAKRRSLLPAPKGFSVGASRRAMLSPTEEEQPKQRPATMIETIRPTRLAEVASPVSNDSSRSPSPDSKEAARERAHAALMGHSSATGSGSGNSSDSGLTSRQAAPASNKPVVASLSRTTSTRKAPVTRAPITSGPDTVRSSIATRPTAAAARDRQARPESVASTTSTTSRLGQSAAAASSRLQAPASASTNLRRTATTAARHSRTQSALPSATAGATQPRADIRRHPTISEGSEPRLQRPAFSTLQQHYSPKKNLAPKPASATLIHAQPIDTGSTLGIDVQMLQARLLQLSILHRNAAPTYCAWEASARRKLKHKFADVAAECEVVREKEREVQKKANAEALKEWCSGDLGMLAEHVTIFSDVVHECMQLVEDGGRVQQAIEMFEAWITWVEAIYQGREKHHSGSSHTEFIDGLGDGWKSEVASLLRKLMALLRQLDGLPKVGTESSLSEMFDGTKSLLRGSVAELKAVESIEAEVVRQERQWVDEQIGAIQHEIAALLKT